MEGVLHAEEGAEVAGDEEDKGEWCEIGPETDHEWEKALDEKINETIKNRLSPHGSSTLEALIREHAT